jgi:hypothetical protein
MTLLNLSERSETRILSRIGVIVVLCIVIATALYLFVEPFGRRPQDVMTVVIEVPYVGQGVAAGTPVIMHGVQVGEVTEVRSISNGAGGGVRLMAHLQPNPTRGLTDAMKIDYRPSNYFGVTGINVTPGQNGRPLRSGMHIRLTPKGNFSLQALLYRLGELSNGVFNRRMVSVIERATRYIDALNPLLETALIAGTSVAKVQTVSTERLLRNATGVSVAFPAVIDAGGSAGNDVLYTFPGLGETPETFEKTRKANKYWDILPDEWHWQYYQNANNFFTHRDDFFNRTLVPFFSLARSDLFGEIGKLEGMHSDDLLPIIGSVRALTDAVPKVFNAQNFASTLTELRSRFERMYAVSGNQHALQVRLVLDRLPGVAAPLGVVMGTQG